MQKSRALSTIAAQQINHYIAQNQLTPGDRLPTEPELMKYCGVSRTTLREAVHQLQYAGILVVKQGSGTYVKSPIQILVDNPILRKNMSMIEREVIDELMATEIDWGALFKLKPVLAQRNQYLLKHQFKAFIDADVQFHTSVVDLAGNSYLSKWYRELLPLWRVHLNETIQSQSRFADNISYHEQLVNALINKDKQLAMLMIEYVGNQS